MLGHVFGTDGVHICLPCKYGVEYVLFTTLYTIHVK